MDVNASAWVNLHHVGPRQAARVPTTATGWKVVLTMYKFNASFLNNILAVVEEKLRYFYLIKRSNTTL